MSLLEKWLEGVGNSNTCPGVKKEKKDWKASFQNSRNEFLASKPASATASTSSSLGPSHHTPAVPVAKVGYITWPDDYNHY